MGQRANLILVEAEEYQLYYNHWCANTLPSDLFWGPEHGIEFVRLQREVDESGWLDEIWAEGGAVVDIDEQFLLLYGGEDVLFDVPLRRMFLELMAKTWKGWTIRWAHEGIADIADYVGYGRDQVLTASGDEFDDVTLTPPEDRDWTELVASVRFDDGALRFFPLAGIEQDFLFSGPALFENVRVTDGLPRLNLAEWTSNFPKGGFHVDLAARRLDFWSASHSTGILDRVGGAWPGWESQWHFDRYESQLKLAGGLLQFPEPQRQPLLLRCREILLHEVNTSGLNSLLAMRDQADEEGKPIEINPFALRDDRLAISREKRIAILDRAAAEVAG